MPGSAVPASPPQAIPQAGDPAAQADIAAAAGVEAAALQKIRIVPPKGWQALDLKELWRYRELTWFLALRDIKVRYKQTALGVIWAVLQPLLQTFIFTLLLYRIGNMEGWPGVPATLAVFCGMIPWQLFESSLTNAGNSLVGSQNLISKVYFPRLSIPISTIIAAIVDFLIAFGLLIVMVAVYALALGYQFRPTAAIFLLPVFIVMAVLAALAVGLWLSALNVQYRDVRYVIPFLARVWLFVTPVVYPAKLIAEKYGPVGEIVFGLNPMTGVVEGFRWALLGMPAPPVLLLSVSTAATFILLIGGLYYFRRMEQTFADIV
ncbi:ABC transporter permease [Humisphaera borealis]|uniref:Transport permease protein n=1 Tax=Humisphaera borealis TaxID=2807512 RepID=A0A7M2X140_9BACT|nr:ABC transporter permease [Humisphaera borealis]QOV91413.1 ABC transporter permease [Humisphaera borealis]